MKLGSRSRFYAQVLQVFHLLESLEEHLKVTREIENVCVAQDIRHLKFKSTPPPSLWQQTPTHRNAHRQPLHLGVSSAPIGGAKAKRREEMHVRAQDGWRAPGVHKDRYPGAHTGAGMQGEGVRAPCCLSACLGSKWSCDSIHFGSTCHFLALYHQPSSHQNLKNI